MKQSLTYSELSPHLFWDVDPGKIDFDKSKAWVIDRVLSHGLLSDWEKSKRSMGKKRLNKL